MHKMIKVTVDGNGVHRLPNGTVIDEKEKPEYFSLRTDIPKREVLATNEEIENGFSYAMTCTFMESVSVAIGTVVGLLLGLLGFRIAGAVFILGGLLVHTIYRFKGSDYQACVYVYTHGYYERNVK